MNDDDGATASTVENDYGKAAYLLPRIAATISLFAVVCTMTECAADLRKSQSELRLESNQSATRVLLAYQIPLFLMHLMQVWGQAAMARDTGKWGAYGNWSTCEAQGFVLFGSQMCGLIWDACLSSIFLLKVSYKWEEARVRKLVFYMHLISWPVLVLAPIFPLMDKTFNDNTEMCKLESDRNDCIADSADPDKCKSPSTIIFIICFSLIPLVVGGFSIYTMTSIWRRVRALAHNLRQLGSHEASERLSQRLEGWKGFLYASTMLLSTVGSTVNAILYEITGENNKPLTVFANMTLGLLGFFNMLVLLARRSRNEMSSRYGRLLKCAVDELIRACRWSLQVVSVLFFTASERTRDLQSSNDSHSAHGRDLFGSSSELDSVASKE